MSIKQDLSKTELVELLRYFLGNPPYVVDAHFRNLAERFVATDEREPTDDPRVSPAGLEYLNEKAEETEKLRADREDDEQTADVEEKRVIDPADAPKAATTKSSNK